jgi:hypothetical protein
MSNSHQKSSQKSSRDVVIVEGLRTPFVKSACQRTNFGHRKNDKIAIPFSGISLAQPSQIWVAPSR